MKKLITTLGLIASANVFAYTANVDNQSNLDLVVKANGSTICTIAAKTKSDCPNLDAYTTYAVNYKLNATSEQGLITLQKNSSQVLQSTPVTSSAALAHYVISYQANYAGGVYLGVLDNFINSQGGYNLSGACSADVGGVTCKLSNSDNLQQLNITAQSDFVPAPAPAPTAPPTNVPTGPPNRVPTAAPIAPYFKAPEPAPFHPPSLLPTAAAIFSPSGARATSIAVVANSTAPPSIAAPLMSLPAFGNLERSPLNPLISYIEF